MIHEVGQDLQAQLTAQGCPFSVYDGPERRRTSTFGRERIVIEHDDSGDTFAAKHLAGVNPKNILTRSIACKITIYAQAPAAAAFEFEHRRRAEHVLDMVLCGLYKVATIRRNTVQFTGGKFVDPEELKASEDAGGASYVLTFRFDRGVADRLWNGGALTEITLGPNAGQVKVASATKVSAAGDPANTDPSSVPSDAETV